MKIFKMCKKKLKSQKGAISTLVLFTILMFIVILLGIYYAVNAKQKAQLESDLRIQKLYGADIERVDAVYDERESKMDKTAPTVTITALPSNIVEDGLIRYYDGKNIGSATTWKDLTGSYDGIINGATVNTAGGYVSFDGVDDYVNIGQVVNKSTITLEAEFMMNTQKNYQVYILGNAETGGCILAINANGKPGFFMYSETDNKYFDCVADDAISPNVSYNITGTYDGISMKIYVDGELKKEINQSNGGPTTGSKIKNPNVNTIMALGANPYKETAQNSYNNMRLYSARIYDRALSEDEIKQNIDVTLDLNFSETIKDLDVNGITVTNASEWTIQGGGNSYTMKVSSVKNDVPLTVQIAAGKYKDLKENLGEECTFTYKKEIKDSYATAYEKNYTKLNYIEGTGTQYIDTGFKPDKNTGIETDFQFTDTTGQQRIMGVEGLDSNSTSFDYEIYINGTAASGGQLAYAYKDGTGNWASTGITADTNKHKLKFNVSPYDPSETNNFELDSTKKAIAKSKTENGTTTNFTFNNTSKVNMLIMARGLLSGKVNSFAKIRIYGFNIYERGYIAKQLIPCKRNSDGKPGLYDRINHEFFTNSGTGEFTIGT